MAGRKDLKRSIATEHAASENDVHRLENFTFDVSDQHPSHTSGKARMTISRKSSTDSLFKVVLLGDCKVGKSSIVMRLVDE